jgi:hypothetical protein
MQRVSAYRLTLLVILWAGIAVESGITTKWAHLHSTGVLRQFPMRIEGFEGADQQDPSSDLLRKTFWPAAIVDRHYSNGAGAPFQVFVFPDTVGGHTQDVCAFYNGWKILQETSGVLRRVPLVKLNRTIEVSPAAPGSPSSSLLACDQYWRRDERGYSQEESDSLLLRGSFCFRVLICTEIQSLPGANDAFARLDDFAASADPVVCQFLQKAEAE